MDLIFDYVRDSCRNPFISFLKDLDHMANPKNPGMPDITVDWFAASSD